ncbi:DsbA family protein [Patescibacteria group bacterium]|nr:DsbA family protein [Patescibacteria group bacterium]
MKKLLLLIPIILLTSCNYEASEMDAMTLGNPNASVLIEEFSDIECPACGQISPQVEEVVRNNLDIVQLKYYHFPLSYHEYAFTGAEAVECANNQGKGWEYLGELFANQKNLSDDYFYSLADTFELNSDQFQSCLDGHAMKAKVQAHQNEGRVRQIPGTPSLFVNGQMVKWPGAEEFETYLKSL